MKYEYKYQMLQNNIYAVKNDKTNYRKKLIT